MTQEKSGYGACGKAGCEFGYYPIHAYKLGIDKTLCGLNFRDLLFDVHGEQDVLQTTGSTCKRCDRTIELIRRSESQ